MGTVKFSASLLLVLLVSTTVEAIDVGRVTEPTEYEDCRIVIDGGGCPDDRACDLKCRPCLKAEKQGLVISHCDEVEKHKWQCICEFYQGATCPPFEGCPYSPSPPLLD